MICPSDPVIPPPERHRGSHSTAPRACPWVQCCGSVARRPHVLRRSLLSGRHGARSMAIGDCPAFRFTGLASGGASPEYSNTIPVYRWFTGGLPTRGHSRVSACFYTLPPVYRPLTILVSRQCIQKRPIRAHRSAPKVLPAGEKSGIIVPDL